MVSRDQMKVDISFHLRGTEGVKFYSFFFFFFFKKTSYLDINSLQCNIKNYFKSHSLWKNPMQSYLLNLLWNRKALKTFFLRFCNLWHGKCHLQKKEIQTFLGLLEWYCCRFTKATLGSGMDCSEEATLQVQVDAFSKALLHLITFVYHATN